MKIAFLINPQVLNSGRSNGIRMQALEWKEAIEKKGHSVELVNNWQHYNWQEFDILHFFSTGYWLELIPILAKKNPNIAVSPIIDTNTGTLAYKAASFAKIPFLRLHSINSKYRDASKYVKLHFARSQYEASLIKAATKNPKIKIVPLSPRIQQSPYDPNNKEDFCLHISSFTQPRKNAMRLMQASAKYGFNLVIAGNKGTEASFRPFKEFADKHSNIKILGFQTEQNILELYSKAKVFALPSIEEGVGLVALEAAVQNCGIVITNKGGPKEYYADKAYIVNPYSINDIGSAVIKAFQNPKQPELKNRILNLYSQERCASLIIEGYNGILKQSN